MIDNILIISPSGYTASQCFYDVAMSFASALKQLGNEVQVTINPEECEGQTLVFGAHLIPKLGGTIDGDYIIYQTEQLTAGNSLFVDQAYIDLLKRFPVWDYSPVNIGFLKGHGIEAKYVPVGYSKCMSNIKTGRSASLMGGGKNGKQRIDFAEWSGVYPPVGEDGKFVQDIDIAWFGSICDRRKKILEELMAVKINDIPITVASFVGYGGFRDKIIARSKIVLNMHYYDSAIFEIFRCGHLFANKKCVVSELGNDIALEERYRETGGFVAYDGIVSKCVSLLQDREAREAIAKKGFEIFSTVTQAEILK